MDKTSRRSRLSWSIWRSVAAVLVVAAVGGLLYRQITDSFRSGEEQVIVARIEPGRTQAVLITGKGQQLLLQGLKDTCLNLAENETLKINEDGSLKYPYLRFRGCRNGTRCGFLKEGSTRSCWMMGRKFG